jgi:hypothetical protein
MAGFFIINAYTKNPLKQVGLLWLSLRKASTCKGQHNTENRGYAGTGWKPWTLCLGYPKQRGRCDRLVWNSNDRKSGYGVTHITKVKRPRVRLYPTVNEVRLLVSADTENAASTSSARRHLSSRTYLLRRAVVSAVSAVGRRRQRRASRRPAPCVRCAMGSTTLCNCSGGMNGFIDSSVTSRRCFSYWGHAVYE